MWGVKKCFSAHFFPSSFPVKNFFFIGWGQIFFGGVIFFWWGESNERLEADHVSSGPMRGLKGNCIQWRKHTDGHGDSMTENGLSQPYK